MICPYCRVEMEYVYATWLGYEYAIWYGCGTCGTTPLELLAKMDSSKLWDFEEEIHERLP